MNKRHLTILLVFLIIIVSCVSFSCKKPDETLEISLIADGTLENGTLTTISKGNASLPTVDKSGYKFNGWFLDESLQTPYNEAVIFGNTDFRFGGKGTTYVYASWEPISFDIQYILNGGVNNPNNPTQYTIEDYFTLEIPTRVGDYVFDGWYNNQLFFGQPITEISDGTIADIKLYAKWLPYDIKYVLFGGSNNANNVLTYDGSQEVMLYAPTRVGYIFEGWYDNQEYDGTVVSNIPKGSARDKTLYAKWDVKNYSIQYTLNGGANNSNNLLTYDITKSFELRNATRDGYQFLGWFDESNNEEVTSILLGTTGNISLYAKWQPILYSIVYALDGGTNNDNNPLTFTIDDEVIFHAPSKIGYDFLRWVDGINNEVIKINAGTTNIVVIYAKWTVKKYSIEYNVDGGDNHSNNPRLYDIEDNITLLPAVKANYEFKGWYSNNQFEGEKITRLPLDNEITDLILYAKFLYRFSVTYELNHGRNNSSNPMIFTKEDTIILADPTRNGYEFNGWYDTQDFSGDRIEQISYGTENNLKFYASWILVTYNVNYEFLGGEQNGINPNAYTIEDNIILHAPIRVGHEFLGWYDNDNFDGDSILALSNGKHQHLNLYAKWKAINYTIIYNLYGGSNNRNNPASYTINDEITFANATRTGFVFDGWYLDSAHSNSIFGIDRGSIGILEIHAKFLPTYAIQYETNGGINDSRNPSTYTTRDSFTIYAAQKPGSTFKGWYGNNSFVGQPITQIEQGEIGEKTLYAKFLENYSITYELSNGINSNNNPNVYTEEDEIIFDSAERNGYTFLGWFDSNDYSVEITGIQQGSTSSLTVYAKWEIIVYDIIYHLDGGENNQNNTDTYTVEINVTLYEPIKEGFRFKGWFYNTDFTGTPIENIESGSIGDREIYARFLYIYSISYILNDGENNAFNPIVFTTDIIIELYDAQKEGYEFIGWQFDGDIITTIEGIAEDIILEAIFQVISYNIIYVTDGGTTNSPINYTINESVELLPAEKEHFLFLAWYDNSEFEGEEIEVIEQGTIGDRTLYAHYQPYPYPIIYHLDGGQNNQLNPNTYTIFDEITLRTPLKNEYVFLGWYDTPSFDNSVTSISQGNYNEINLYAKWQVKEYKIVYVLFGGNNSSLNITTYTIEDHVNFYQPTRENYFFSGWYSSDTRGRTSDDLERDGITSITSLNVGSVGNKTLYARWESSMYSINYVLNGGHNNNNNPVSYTRDSQITLYAPIKAGFTFLGWYTTSDFSGQRVYTIPTNSYGEKTFYAKFSLTFLIEYILNGGTYKNEPVTYTTEDEDIILEAPIKPGFIFKGWYDNAEFLGQPIIKLAKGSTGDKVFIAKFLQEYRITYELNHGLNNENNIGTFTREDEFTFFDAERSGHAFMGWYYNADFTDDAITQLNIGTENNIILYAKFLLLINLTYILNGGQNSINNPLVVNVEDSITLEEATRDGYAFEGWYGNANFLGEEITRVGSTNTDITNLYARWSIIEYTITYILNGGLNDASNVSVYTIEDSDIELFAAGRNYYDFKGWYDNEELSGISITTLPQGSINNRIFYAKWQATEYTITYILNNGINSSQNPSTYTILSGSITLQTPERQGASFVNWYDNPNFTGSPVSIITAESYGNRVFYARWSLISYSITYHVNDGVNPQANPAEYNIEQNIVLNDAIKAQYTFIGWYFDADFEGEKVNTISNMTGNLDIYARFSVTYLVNYMLDGGNNNSNNPSSYTELSQTITLLAPTKQYYNFINWYEDENFSDPPIIEISTGSIGIKTLYAKWEATSYSITYQLDGGNNNNNPNSYTIESNISLNQPSKTGYNFIGWYDNSRHEGNAINSLPTTNIVNIILYAKWEIITYTIEYQLNGGENVPNNPIRYDVRTNDITLYSAVRDFYNFEGWYDNPNLNGLPITSIYQGSIGDIYLYAKWELVFYNINYVLGDNAFNSEDNPQSYTHDDTYTLEEPLRAYYTFGGWYTNKYFTGIPIEVISQMSGELDLYANWIPISFDINYSLNGGVNHLDNPLSYTIETNIVLKSGTKANSNFMGWYENANFYGQPLIKIENMVGNRTLYAKFLFSYEIVYELDGGQNNINNLKSYTSEDTVTLYPAEKDNHIFMGWYDNADFEGLPIAKIEEGSEGEKLVFACFIKAYRINYYLNGGENNPLNPTYYLEGVDEELGEPFRANYIFLGWYLDSQFLGEPLKVIEGQTKQEISLYARWGEWVHYMYYGEYPQTVVSDVNIIANLNNGINSQQILPDSQGYYKYQEYRYARLIPLKSSNGYIAGQSYYFKIESIKWRIIKHNTGCATLLCDIILDSLVYNSLYEDIVWEHSTIREWLNSQFLISAFSDDSHILIAQTDNSINLVHNTGSGDTTYDKVSLLSIESVTNFDFGFDVNLSMEDLNRRALVSDYAAARGAYCDEYGYGMWWLYTPGANMKYVSYVGTEGKIYANGNNVTMAGYGVRPTIEIQLYAID